MNIGILSKRTTMFTGKIKTYLENKGFNVSIHTLENLVINEALFNNNFYILKSKNLFFLYSGYFLEANNIPVIPKPEVSFVQKNRIHSHFVMRKIGLTTPNIYLGAIDTLEHKLNQDDFPFILKPIMGSGSKGVKIVKSVQDLHTENNRVLYLEQFIKGVHYNVYFIGNNICTLIKPPLSNEHVDMEKVKTPDDIKKLIKKWRAFFKGDVMFGHLDIVREEGSNKIYVVDPGSFPEFTNWKCDISPVKKICDLILKQFKKWKKNRNDLM
ncbi:MAG: ATP-grasp domain-containing protein [Promethearchaeota archaeon]|jgi:hypothetical protein